MLRKTNYTNIDNTQENSMCSPYTDGDEPLIS